jgi:putative flippase GtrA
MVVQLTRSVLRQHSAIVGEILRFGVVGTFGFVVDTATVYATRGALGLYGAGLAAFFVAGSANWALNRWWTFRGRAAGAPVRAQLLRYLGANLIGFTINRGVYAAAVTFSAAAASQPVLATAAGAIAGMGFNFVLSRQLVFR